MQSVSVFWGCGLRSYRSSLMSTSKVQRPIHCAWSYAGGRYYDFRPPRRQRGGLGAGMGGVAPSMTEGFYAPGSIGGTDHGLGWRLLKFSPLHGPCRVLWEARREHSPPIGVWFWGGCSFAYTPVRKSGAYPGMKVDVPPELWPGDARVQASTEGLPRRQSRGHWTPEEDLGVAVCE